MSMAVLCLARLVLCASKNTVHLLSEAISNLSWLINLFESLKLARKTTLTYYGTFMAEYMQLGSIGIFLDQRYFHYFFLHQSNSSSCTFSTCLVWLFFVLSFWNKKLGTSRSSRRRLWLVCRMPEMRVIFYIHCNFRVLTGFVARSNTIESKSCSRRSCSMRSYTFWYLLLSELKLYYFIFLRSSSFGQALRHYRWFIFSCSCLF